MGVLDRYKSLIHDVASISARSTQRPGDIDDLAGYAAVGVLVALAEWDESRGVPLGAHVAQRAWWAVADGQRAMHPVPHSFRDAGLVAEMVGLTWAEHEPTTFPGPSETAQAVELRERVEAALWTLEPEDRRILIERFWLGMKRRDICAVTGHSPSWVTVKIKRALVRMARALKDGGHDE